MNEATILMDGNYLCHRAYYSHRMLESKGVLTGMLFGVLNDVSQLRDRFLTNRFAFFFDSTKQSNLRKKSFGDYKRHRHKEMQKKEKIEINQLITKMEFEQLPETGLRSIFSFKGYEADDLIAVAKKHIPTELVIVSADTDLWQLIDKRTSFYNPRSKDLMTDSAFRSKFQIKPEQYAEVKAIAGCNSDSVDGVEGVGEKTAVKYIRGLITSGKIFDAIQNSSELIKRNRRIVTLPYKGAQLPGFIQYDEADFKFASDGWRALCNRFEIQTLRSKCPK